ncbi:hypothetical protein GCM10027048_08410 [Hymenobacter coalescens]
MKPALFGLGLVALLSACGLRSTSSTASEAADMASSVREGKRALARNAGSPTRTTVTNLFPTAGVEAVFAGRVGRWEATFLLTRDSGGGISGTYQYYKRPNVTYDLLGVVNPDNSLTLTELTNGQVSATCLLKPAGGCLEGMMNNTDGRQLMMSLCPASPETGK